MKKIEELAINHRNSAVSVDVSKLRETGVGRDAFRFVKDDVISFPEELTVWMDSFTPKGQTEAKEYYLVTTIVNKNPVDITMASMRRSRMVKDEDLTQILNNEVCRQLHQAGDDEQRALYLQGKTFKVSDVVKSTNRWDDKLSVFVPLFEEVK